VKGGKRGHYLNYGLCIFEEADHDLSLNFTHRNAHGGDADVANKSKHGALGNLAESELARLKSEFP
jgi:hypothetical protein